MSKTKVLKEKTEEQQTAEVINEEVKEVTGKSVEDLQKEVEENEKKIDQAFREYIEPGCKKFKRSLSITPGQIGIKRG